MPFNITPDVKARRDEQGKVRQLSHVNQPYSPDAVALAAAGFHPGANLTPRALAEQYLRDVAPVLDFPPAALGNFSAVAAPSPQPADTELRFREEKNISNLTTVSYDQTHFGLPIWDAGVTVRVDTLPMQVTGAQNASHYDIKIDEPPQNAPFRPNLIDVPQLRRLLNLAPSDQPRINSTRMLVYQFLADDRIDPQIAAHDAQTSETGFAGEAASSFPQLPLPPLKGVVDGMHYVVTEVLFTMPWERWGTLNWRAFIEIREGAVLYLRALVSCANGSVFRSDPVTLSGTNHTAATAAQILDPLRTTVSLQGLVPVISPQTRQELRGNFVAITNVEDPAPPFPAEVDPFDFVYSCPTPDFASCSAYFHCDSVFRLMQSMGIDVKQYFNGTTLPVPVDPHALDNEVNAQARGNATGNGMGAFVFGVAQNGQTMGIAADVRVVLHEFGHALLWDHVNSPNFGFAHSAGDSLAAILHDPGNRADRFETFPFMKASAGLSRRHDRDVTAGWAWGGPSHLDNTQYGSEQILSTTMFRIYCAAGGDSSDLQVRKNTAFYVASLIFKGCGLLSFTSRDPDVFVTALTDADAATINLNGQPGGAYSKVIRWSFEQQGLYQPPGAPKPVHAPGAPPEVDVYIDDGRNGEYMPYRDAYEGTPEIWNRVSADGGTQDQIPTVGMGNFAYARVKNRGTGVASNVVVRAFVSKIANPARWPTDWSPATTAQFVLPSTIPAGGNAVVGPFNWTPPFPHAALLLSVSASGDRSNLELITTGPIENRIMVPLDNNIAQKTFS